MLWTTGRSARGQGTKVWAFPKPAQGGRCEGRGWARLYAVGSVHGVGFLGPRNACPGQGRKGLQQEEHISKCLFGLVGSKHSKSHVRHWEGSPFHGPLRCAAQPSLSRPLQLWPEGMWAGGSSASSLGGLVGAFTKCRLTCLQGEQGSALKLALEHGHLFENLLGRKQRVSSAALAW